MLTKIVAQEDDTVEVGGELAVIGEAGEREAAQAARRRGSRPPKSPPRRTRTGRRTEPEPEPEPEAEPEPAPKPAAQPLGGGEATSVKMPELGESVTEGTVTRWLKKVGDTVEVDEPLVEVSTDKVDTEIPSPVAGTLLSITAEEDDTVAVGGELAKIGDAGAAAAPRHPSRSRNPSPNPNQSPSPNRNRSPKPEPAPRPSPNPSPNPSRNPSPHRPPQAPEPSGDGARTSPRWCESWPPRTTSTWRR